MIKYLLPLLTIFLIGCNSEKKEDYTYFGGKIINPKEDFVLLFDDEKVLDTIQLSADNTFTGKLKNIKEGLYYFTHGGEFQFVYLEPKDSLLIRLNTWDFDESLVFSGKNSPRNNLLIDAFLTDENQRKHFYEYHKLNPTDFKAKVDSILIVKDIRLKNYIDVNEETSEDFIEIAKVALKYPVYSEIESYIIGNSIKKDSIKLDDSFFKHREKTSLNKDTLMFYSPYNSYVFESLYSDIYQQKIKKNSDDFTIALIDNVDKRITSEKLKNKILKNSLIRHFLNKSNCNLSERAFNRYYELSTNKEDIEKIKNLVNDAKSIKNTTQLPNFSLKTITGKEKSIKDITKNKASVIYFRNNNYSSDEWVASKINTLQNKYPDIQFLVVDLLGREHLNEELAPKYQFYLTKNSSAKDFLTSEFPRAMLIDKKGEIKNGFASLSSPKIIQQIKGLEN